MLATACESTVSGLDGRAPALLAVLGKTKELGAPSYGTAQGTGSAGGALGGGYHSLWVLECSNHVKRAK
jgi:hypothetical protein